MRLIRLKDNPSYKENFLTLKKQSLKESQANYVKSNLRETMSKVSAENCFDVTHESFLCDIDGTIVGFCEILLEEECLPVDDLPQLSAVITSLYVNPEMRNKHIGAEFFKLIKQWARETGVEMLEVSFPHGKPQVIEFFQKQGMELIGSGVNYNLRLQI